MIPAHGIRNEQAHLWVVARVYPPDEGGVQTYTREIAQAHAALGWRVTAFAKSSAGPRQTTQGRVTLIDVGPGSKLATYLRLFVHMRRALKAGSPPDVIHAATWRAALAALPFGRPLVVTLHGRELGRTKGPALLLMRMVLRRAARILAVSNATLQLLQLKLPEFSGKAVVAWNATVRPPERPPTPFQRGQGQAEILSLCRLVPRKNIPAAVTAAATCATDGRNFRYRIAGRGPEAPLVARRVAAAGLGQRILQLGFVPDEEVTRLYRESDIFLHPQIALEGGDEMEGFGLSIADAMAHGLVCIVGSDGGPAELIRHGVTGFIVNGRSIEEIRATLDRLVSDPGLCATIGGNARKWALENLSWERHCALGTQDIGRLPELRNSAPTTR